MRHLEKDKLSKKDNDPIDTVPKNNFQLNLFEADPHFEEVRKMLNNIDINTISPIEALLKLNEIKDVLKGNQSR
jgi:DNA mismatch repair protein MutS